MVKFDCCWGRWRPDFWTIWAYIVHIVYSYSGKSFIAAGCINACLCFIDTCNQEFRLDGGGFPTSIIYPPKSQHTGVYTHTLSSSSFIHFSLYYVFRGRLFFFFFAHKAPVLSVLGVMMTMWRDTISLSDQRLFCFVLFRFFPSSFFFFFSFWRSLWPIPATAIVCNMASHQVTNKPLAGRASLQPSIDLTASSSSVDKYHLIYR